MAARYRYGQLEQLWRQAGGSGVLAPVMAAIALAESGGRIDAVHRDSDGSTDYGLWQINSVHGYNSRELLANPAYNAKAAVSIEHSQGLHAWSSYNNGSYRRYMSGGGSSGSGGPYGGLPYNPNDSSVGRIDEGVDITSGSPFVAVAPGRVVHIDPNFYNGTPAVYIKLDQPVQVNGRTYRGVYYSETRPFVRVGQHVDAGDPIIGRGTAEIGFASRFGRGPSSWLPSAHATYHEGDQTQAGQDFASTIKPPHSGGGGFWSDFLSGLNPLNTPANIAGAVGGAASAAGGVVSGVESVGSFLGKLTDPHFWLRALEVVGGGILVLLGLYLLARQIGLATTPPQLPAVGPAARLSDGAAAEMQFSPGRAAAPRRSRRLDVSEAAERRRAIRRRAAAAEPSNEIPF